MKVLFGAFVGRHGKGCQECGEDDIYIYLESSHFLQVLSSMALSFEFSIGLRILPSRNLEEKKQGTSNQLSKNQNFHHETLF